MWTGRTGWWVDGSAAIVAVPAYWTWQFGLIDSDVERIGFELDSEGRIFVDVHQVVRDLEGALLSDGPVRHAYTFRDGLVERMDFEEAM
jgi:hypothetical protein